jgi:hypothetical protein
MKKLYIGLLLALFTLSLSAKEGMWIPYLLKQLNEGEMRDMGLQLSAEDIYSVNHSSLKDAVVHFGGGCTAELIGSQGLLLTNHHCGYGQIQSHSSLEHDYLKNGFWAMNKSEELKNPGLTAAIVRYMRDVTNEVFEGVEPGMDAAERAKKIKANAAALAESEAQSSGYDIEVEPFFYGNQYILIAKETFKDVRLVGAPPSSIGKYGADTDNWMWPRHTGDFSMFRIYAGKDNKPAALSDDNIPYKPAQFLTVSLNGFKQGDFTMVYGFPGRTQEYLPASEVGYTMNNYDPFRIDIRNQILEILDAKMRKDDATRIKYAAKYARISNSWKKWIGEVDGLRETNAVGKKEALEAEFALKVVSDKDLKATYGFVLDSLNTLYAAQVPVNLQRYAYLERMYYGTELMRHMLRYRKFVEEAPMASDSALTYMANQLTEGMDVFYKNYDAELESEVFAAMFPAYLSEVSLEPLPELLQTLKTQKTAKTEAFGKDVFGKSVVLQGEEKFLNLLRTNPAKAAKALKNDKAYQLAVAMYDHYRNTLNPAVAPYAIAAEELQGTYVAGLQQVFPDKRFYPDANSTLRVAYGKVEPYDPIDGIMYKTQTFLDGVMAKYVPGDYEFDLPERLIELYNAKDYGQYAQGDKLPVCFIASNHTTGGNSGSPALNGKGELIGLNFDRAWEGTMSDINYDFSRCRNIMVDIRYVLFVVDKFAGAGYLLDEMRFATAEEPAAKPEAAKK